MKQEIVNFLDCFFPDENEVYLIEKDDKELLAQGLEEVLRKKNNENQI